MNKREILTVNFEGGQAEVTLTELTPGRWCWAVRMMGQSPIQAQAPAPTRDAALACVREVLRAQARALKC